MNTPTHGFGILATTAVASLLLVACSAVPTKPEGADNVRSKLTQLQSDPQLASRAPVDIKEAEVAVKAAEKPQRDTEVGTHLVLMADRKVDIAAARAQARLLEDQRRILSEQREEARLDARTREVDVARSAATAARHEASIARSETVLAQNDASMARNEAEVARSETAAAGMAVEAAWDQADELQRQLFELNAKTTERGLVVTLGDVLFATGKSGIKGSATNNLGKLAVFLNKYPDRTVVIEGHTDSLGSDEFNLVLSQQRADAVKSWLASQGIAPARIVAFGKGESAPVAGNDSDYGRQQNRRVEVIIPNLVTPSNQ